MKESEGEKKGQDINIKSADENEGKIAAADADADADAETCIHAEYHHSGAPVDSSTPEMSGRWTGGPWVRG